ncbi:MAG: hypothetical protein R6V06_00835 [Kiritimatiellia bacterium]
MSGKIDLKDGFCVSCGLKSGVVYQSCPFCDEMVWHPLWRRIVFRYVVLPLPVLTLIFLFLNSSALAAIADLFAAASWKLQIAVMLPVSVLLLPYENRRLIHTSVKNYFLWLLNALAASVILLLCVLLLVVGVRFSEDALLLRFVMCITAVSASAVPLVMNCNWQRLSAAAFAAGALMCI